MGSLLDCNPTCDLEALNDFAFHIEPSSRTSLEFAVNRSLFMMFMTLSRVKSKGIDTEQII
jgi:hypothetical protein